MGKRMLEPTEQLTGIVEVKTGVADALWITFRFPNPAYIDARRSREPC